MGKLGAYLLRPLSSATCWILAVPTVLLFFGRHHLLCIGIDVIYWEANVSDANIVMSPLRRTRPSRHGKLLLTWQRKVHRHYKDSWTALRQALFNVQYISHIKHWEIYLFPLCLSPVSPLWR
jgi:hypothetical protein